MWDIETELLSEYGLPYKFTTFNECHVELENAAMVVQSNTAQSMFWEELRAVFIVDS